MILGEVSTLGETMHNLYEDLVTMNKVVVHLHGLQQKYKYFFKTLRNLQVAIVIVHEWSMRYKVAPLDLGKKMKQHEELEKEIVRMMI